MSKVEQIQVELEKLAPSQLQKIRDWLDGLLEQHLHFTNEFERQIRQSEAEMAAGVRPSERAIHSASTAHFLQVPATPTRCRRLPDGRGEAD